jgi:hypothetical protein
MWRSLFVSMMVVTAAKAEPRVFYTAHFPDRTSIEMSVDGVAGDGVYDFDVTIGLAEISDKGTSLYFDPGRHHARIGCAKPAHVTLGDHRFMVHLLEPSDWKRHLWKAYCEASVS